ncbi:POK18 protein, partial [Spizella passerina]|nr:POK18 protein [Spizella passerina]
WRYLGWIIIETEIRPQKLTIRSEIRTLDIAQKLVGDITWTRCTCGITSEDMGPLLQLLKGGSGADA